MGSKTISSVYEIQDEDVQVLYSRIAMGKDAYMCYSYTLNAGQIFQKVKEIMQSICVGENLFFQCTFDDGKIYVNGRYFCWSYSLIESDDDNLGAMIFHIVPSWNEEEAELFIEVCSRIKVYLDCRFKVEECAIDIINIPQKSKALEDNGFSFSHSELADAFRKSVIINSPSNTILNDRQEKKPTWYRAGYTAETTKHMDNLNSSGGCYIATAVYGSYDCPEVWTLRRFRDYSLARSLQGRLFIGLYYAFSPMLVKLFGSTTWFQQFWKCRLDKIVQRLREKGYEDTPYCD